MLSPAQTITWMIFRECMHYCNIYTVTELSLEEYLYLPRHSGAVHAAGHVHRVSPDIILRPAGPDDPGHHRTHINAWTFRNKPSENIHNPFCIHWEWGRDNTELETGLWKLFSNVLKKNSFTNVRKIADLLKDWSQAQQYTCVKTYPLSRRNHYMTDSLFHPEHQTSRWRSLQWCSGALPWISFPVKEWMKAIHKCSVSIALHYVMCSWFSDLGSDGGHQTHRCHIRAADGLDLLNVFITLFVHELQHDGYTDWIGFRAGFL